MPHTDAVRRTEVGDSGTARVNAWPSTALLTAVLTALLTALGAVLLGVLAGETTIYKLGLVAIVFVGALGLHVLVNWCGEISLAQAGFIGIPAFAVAQITTNAGVSPFLLLPVALLLGAALGAIVAVAALRARGLQVALVTLAISIAIVQYLFFKTWLVGPRAGIRLGSLDLFGVKLLTSRSLLPVLVVVLSLAVVTVRALLVSKIGRALLVVRSDPNVAAAIGVPVDRYRGMAYAICGAFAGLAGWTYVVWVQRINPQAFPLQLGFTYLIVAALAGRGGVLGVVIAAVLVQGGELFSVLPHSVMVYLAPAALILTVTRYPDGINGIVRSSMRTLRQRGLHRTASPPAPATPASPSSRSAASAARSQSASRSQSGAAAVSAVSAALAIPSANGAAIHLPMHRSDTDKPLLRIERVSVSFGGLRALDSISLDVEAGSVVGLIGPNGAGKTTLFNVISGLQRADAGRISFDGTDITRLPPHRRAEIGIARSFQNLGLMHDETAVTNVVAALHRSTAYHAADVLARPWRVRRAERRLGDRALNALAAFGVDDEAHRLVSELSFGQARLVEMAAIVAESPRLMLLDEPTTGLDTVEIERLAEVLATVRRAGTTVLLVAHDVDFVMRCCDHVFVLAEGVRLFDGTPEAVRSSPAVAASYLGKSA